MATKSIVATKVGMTQVWDEDNNIVPVTVLRVQPCRVVQIKTPERDGYSALQVTYGHRDARKLSMPKAGHFAAADVDPGEQLVELRLDDVSGYEVGQSITAETFAPGELVDVTGVSKGKGFAGTMKRHGFGGLPASHGAHRVHRKPGAIGACATPARVFKGQKMSGRMGGEKVTTLNLVVVGADPEREIVLVRGSVPGPKQSTVLIRDAVKQGGEVMPSIDVKNTKGDKVSTLDLAEELFGIEPNVSVMHQVVTAQLAAKRSGTQSTKTRAEVRGGGAKPWKQKGTGRARQGSIRSPQWRGGGIALGPKPRKYTQKTPKKMVKLALRSALSDRFASERIIVLDSWALDTPSTKGARTTLETLGTEGRVLAVVARDDIATAKSLRNLPHVHVCQPGELNTYDVLVSDWMIFTTDTVPGLPAKEDAA